MLLFFTFSIRRKISYQDMVHACIHILIHRTAISPYTDDMFAEFKSSDSLTANNIKAISSIIVLNQSNMFYCFIFGV